MRGPEESAPRGVRCRAVVVDAYPVVRHGVALALAAERDLEVVASFGDPAEAARAVTGAPPDVIITELSFADGGGLEVVRSLRAACPTAALLVFSGQDAALYAERAIRAGASGFVSKREELPALVKAVRRVLEGAVHIDEQLVSSGGHAAGQGPRLTDRELEVLEHLGRGLRSREIAEALGLSEKTIEGYRAQLRAKLGLPDAAALLQHAIRWVKLHQA